MIQDLTGKRFGSLVAVKQLEERTKDGKVKYFCKCDCGNTGEYTATALHTGRRKSCGCQCWRKKYERFDIRIYRVWYDIKRRCQDPRRSDYERYGKRGIALCEEWQDYQVFHDWMTINGYEPGLTIDRIDNNGDYEPDNCRLANHEIQANNKRNNHQITFNGETHTMAEWSRITGISYFVIRARQNRGWSDERTLTAPVRGVNA